MNENPLAKLGDLTKPATVLVEKISDAVGGIFKPYQIVRVAKAEAEAEVIQAESQIQVTDLQRRAMHRFLKEEATKQVNIEDITHKALPHIKEGALPQNMEDDWITNFFDKCRTISDDDMQKLWSQVLAGEANSPGTISRKTVNLLADLDKGDAELFMRLCNFGWMIGNIVPLVYDINSEVYNRHGLNFNTLSNLEALGLIQFENLTGFLRTGLPKNAGVLYHSRMVFLTFPKDADNELDIGKVLLTRAGQEIAPVCGSEPVDGFLGFVYDRWAGQSLVPKRETEQGDTSKK